MDITVKDFMKMQPNNPKVTEADKFYMRIAMRLAQLWDNSHRFVNLPEGTRKAVVLAVTGYYQDVIADAGLWRSFVMMHERFYGTPLPFYKRADDYVDYELNVDDLRFVIWYTIEGQRYENFTLSPLDPAIEWLAHLFYKVLDQNYETAPNPVEYNLAVGVDPDDVADANAIYDLSHWLFYDSYLMKPAAKIALARHLIEARDIIESKPRDLDGKIHDLEDRTMLNNPTGPLSLSVGEWIAMIAAGKWPQLDRHPADAAAQPHKLYTAFIAANGGSDIAFFASYDEMEQWMVDHMGWSNAEGDIIPQLRKYANFVVLVNRNRGMLIAHDVAQYIAHPANALYDREAAAREGHKLVTEQGRCPVDLVKYAFTHRLLPDAALPADDTGRLLHDNWDFLLRLYQQGYYND